MGALFTEKRTVKTKIPGGCDFEKRPIDYHLDAFEQMGAIIKEANHDILIKRKIKIQGYENWVSDEIYVKSRCAEQPSVRYGEKLTLCCFLPR